MSSDDTAYPNDEWFMGSDDGPLFEAVLCLGGEGLDPDLVTATLGVPPADLTRELATDDSAPGGVRIANGFWSHCAPVPHDQPLQEHVQCLMDLVTAHQTEWPTLVPQPEGWAYLDCRHVAAAHGDGPLPTALDAGVIQRMAAADLGLHIEYFPPLHWSRRAELGQLDYPDPDEAALGCERATVGLTLRLTGDTTLPATARLVRSSRAAEPGTVCLDYVADDARPKVAALLDGVLAVLEDAGEVRQPLLTQPGSKAWLDCVWVSYGAEGGFTMALAEIRRMAALGLGLQVWFRPSDTWGPLPPEPSTPRSTAKLEICGDGLRTADATAALGVQPTTTIQRGDLVMTRSGRQIRKRWNYWAYDSPLAATADLPEQIDGLLALVESRWTQWEPVLKRHELAMFGDCHWEASHADDAAHGPALSRQCVARLARLDLGLHFEYWPPDDWDRAALSEPDPDPEADHTYDLALCRTRLTAAGFDGVQTAAVLARCQDRALREAIDGDRGMAVRLELRLPAGRSPWSGLIEELERTSPQNLCRDGELWVVRAFGGDALELDVEWDRLMSVLPEWSTQDLDGTGPSAMLHCVWVPVGGMGGPNYDSLLPGMARLGAGLSLDFEPPLDWAPTGLGNGQSQ